MHSSFFSGPGFARFLSGFADLGKISKMRFVFFEDLGLSSSLNPTDTSQTVDSDRSLVSKNFFSHITKHHQHVCTLIDMGCLPPLRLTSVV